MILYTTVKSFSSWILGTGLPQQRQNHILYYFMKPLDMKMITST